MNRNHVLSIGAAAVVTALLLYLLSLANRPAEEPKGEPLLLDVRLERLVRVAPREGGELPEQPTRMEVVCRLRFLARAGLPTAVSLPSGVRSGYALAFVPRVRPVGNDLEFRAEGLSAEMTIHWREELEGAAKDDVWLYHTREGKTLVAKVAEGIVIAGPPSERAAGRVRAEVRYRVILECDGPVSEARLERLDWSIVRLDSEELHLTNTAIPSLMSVGVQLEDLTRIDDQPPGDR